MRVDYTPQPHVCELPPADQFPMGTLISCDGVTGTLFNGRSHVPQACNAQWRRGVTMWRHRPVWLRNAW
jgi:hypothetical protein